MPGIKEEKNKYYIEQSKSKEDELIKILDTSEEVIDFLVKNKDNWDIEDDNIVFSSEKLSNEYDKLIDTL